MEHYKYCLKEQEAEPDCQDMYNENQLPDTLASGFTVVIHTTRAGCTTCPRYM